MKKIKNLLIPTAIVLAIAPITVSVSSCKENKKSYSVVFINSAEEIPNQTVVEGEKAIEPQLTKTEGQAYIFDGWYEDSKFIYKFDFNTPILKDTVLYAKWTLFDGRVTKQEWNNAIKYLLEVSEDRMFNIYTEGLMYTQQLSNRLYVDGYKELYHDDTSVSYPYEWYIGSKDKPWCERYDYYIDSPAQPSRGFSKNLLSQSYKRTKYSWWGYVGFFSFISKSLDGQEYSYDSTKWTYDKTGHLYFTKMIDGQWNYDIQIRFNKDKRIDQFNAVANIMPEEFPNNTYIIVDYSNNPISEPTWTTTKKKVKPNIIKDESVPAGFDLVTEQESPLDQVDYDTKTYNFLAKNNTASAINYKIVVNTTYSNETYKPIDDILEYTGTVDAGSTKTITVNFEETQNEFWKTVKFMGMDCNIKVSVTA